MKRFFVVLILLFVIVACDSKETKQILSSGVGDKFVYQLYNGVDIARSDKDVVVYRLWTLHRYYYYSTTKKDSIIYDIRSVVRTN